MAMANEITNKTLAVEAWSTVDIPNAQDPTSTTIKMVIGNKQALVNGGVYNLNAAPVIVDGFTMLPVRDIANIMGMSVDWDPATKAVTLVKA